MTTCMDPIGHNSHQCILAANGLRKAFGSHLVLDDVDLEINRGDVILLRGANGSGKTTLLDILSGVLAPDDGEIRYFTPGGNAYRFSGRWRDMLHVKSRFSASHLARAGVGRCWQDLRLFSSLSLLENVAVAHQGQTGESLLGALRRNVMSQQERALRSAAIESLRKFGLADLASELPSRISAGQAKRLAIARSVAAGASVLLLDEPLAGLDGRGVDDALATLKRLIASDGRTLIIVEHLFNMQRMLDLATAVWTLDQGQLTIEDVRSVRNEVASADSFGLAKWKAAFLAGLRSVSEMILPGGATLTVVNLDDKLNTPVCLEVSDLVVHRDWRRVIGWEPEDSASLIRGLSFTLRESDLAILEAPNGWGKSTLLDCISGLIPASAGTIAFRGRDITRCTAWERRRMGIGLTGTNSVGFQRLSVVDVLRLAGIHSVPENLRRFRRRPAGTLSGGEYQSLRLAGSMQDSTQIRLLDEPFHMLDYRSVQDLFAQLRGIAPGATLIVVPRPV